MNARDDDKIKVQQATDIVRLIGEHVALRPKGKEFAGLCPFHDNKNPSMQVSPAKQIFKCFSCGAGGDAFSFVMNYHKMTFPEALKHLAEMAGIELTPFMPRGGAAGHDGRQEGPSPRQRISAANQQAQDFYQALLRHPEHGQIARDYLANRGFNEQMIEAFGIGVAPDQWDGLAQMIARHGWDRPAFEQAGLIASREGSPDRSHYDRLRHRLIFPICDALGRPIAFGGRVLPGSKRDDKSDAKYLNSPETPLFNKSATLYGLHLAKKRIIDTKTAVIVEGYTDVIAAHQAGATNVVAALGTALTSEHVTQLRRFADKLVLIFDGDEAGQKAADRAVEVCLTAEIDVCLAVLPHGQDPDEMLGKEDGLATWQKLVDEAQDALAFMFDRFTRQLDAVDTMTGRQRAADQFLDTLARLGFSRVSPLRAAMIVQRLSQVLAMPEAQVRTELSQRSKSLSPRRADDNAAHRFNANQDVAENAFVQTSENSNPEDWQEDSFAPSQTRHKLQALRLAEKQVIGCLLLDNAGFGATLNDGHSLDEALTPHEMVTQEGRALYGRLYEQLSGGGDVTTAGLSADLAADGALALSAYAADAQAHVTLATSGDTTRLGQMLRSGAEAIVGYRRESRYQHDRQALSSEGQSPSDAAQQDKARAIEALIEQRRANPSPVRIARVQA